MGLYYSRAEAGKIVAMLRSNPDRTGCRYEIIEADRHVLYINNSHGKQSKS